MKDGRQGETLKDFTQEDIRFTTKDGLVNAIVLPEANADIPPAEITLRELARTRFSM